ncbi:MAG: chorismate synthase [Thermoplasmata archaeon]
MSFEIGVHYRITVFGESHGECVGVTVEGVPSGTDIHRRVIQEELNKRKPGQSDITTQRKEEDKVEILSGVFNGKATGGPITMRIKNEDVDSSYYEDIKYTPRPGHADYTAMIKYGKNHDHRGGGFFSGRMTAAYVMAGAIAKQILKERDIKVLAHTIQIGNKKIRKELSHREIEENVYRNDLRCADPEMIESFRKVVIAAKREGDSVGGMIEARIIGLDAGIGEPLFDSMESVLSRYLFSIPAVKGVDFGAGMRAASMRGSEHNDAFVIDGDKIVTETNNAGGILGGISNGMPMVIRVAIKPTPSISVPQKTVNMKTKSGCELKVRGRHDPCIAIRVVPVVENLLACAILDMIKRKDDHL